MNLLENIFENDNNNKEFLHDDNYAAGGGHEINNNEPNSIWVFGYGSLCWYPGFTYSKCITGYIRGYVRRFWQGNTSHRGTPDKPGRVATLINEEAGITWGCAYKITGDDALQYLNQRECNLGGYMTLETKFYPRIPCAECKEKNGDPLRVLLYIATDQNQHWLGETSLNTIAEQIVNTTGPSGHNAEYLLRLANFMKEEIPGAYDDHLFTLERFVLDLLAKSEISVMSVMGTKNYHKICCELPEPSRRVHTFEFASRIPERKSRCVNI